MVPAPEADARIQAGILSRDDPTGRSDRRRPGGTRIDDPTSCLYPSIYPPAYLPTAELPICRTTELPNSRMIYSFSEIDLPCKNSRR